MKILIYGAGVIGCTYGWQLAKAGHHITVWIRQGKKPETEENGIRIICTDFRKKQKHITHTVFRPKVIRTLIPDNDFEYIIVSTNCLYLKDVLPALAETAGKAHILFFQNIWDDFDRIAGYLSPDRYFFGFPFAAGGGKIRNCIDCTLSGMKNSATLLGEIDGTITPRLLKIAEALQEAGLKPILSRQIDTWLITHYVIAACLAAGIVKAGSSRKFTDRPGMLRETIKAVREGFKICRKRGIDPKTEKANRPYYLPLFFLLPVLKKIYRHESLCRMFDGHIRHAPREIRKMIGDIVSCGEKYDLQMSCLKSLQKATENMPH